jgi:hypothetical protein
MERIALRVAPLFLHHLMPFDWRPARRHWIISGLFNALMHFDNPGVERR